MESCLGSEGRAPVAPIGGAWSESSNPEESNAAMGAASCGVVSKGVLTGAAGEAEGVPVIPENPGRLGNDCSGEDIGAEASVGVVGWVAAPKPDDDSLGSGGGVKAPAPKLSKEKSDEGWNGPVEGVGETARGGGAKSLPGAGAKVEKGSLAGAGVRLAAAGNGSTAGGAIGATGATGVIVAIGTGAGAGTGATAIGLSCCMAKGASAIPDG